MPLAVRMLTSALDEIPQDQFKLAETLRFGVTGRFVHLLMPALLGVLPGIAGLVFLLCAGSYTIVLTLGGGPQAVTLQVAIQQALSIDFDPGRAALLTLAQLALTFLVLAMLPRSSVQPVTKGVHQVRRWHSSGPWEGLASAIAIILATLFVGLPLLALVISGLSAEHFRILASPSLAQALATSAAIALISAMLAVAAALAIAAATCVLQAAGKNVWWIERMVLATLGMPPLVLGAGWFMLLLMLGQPFALARS